MIPLRIMAQPVRLMVALGEVEEIPMPLGSLHLDTSNVCTPSQTWQQIFVTRIETFKMDLSHVS